ncbi:hypothetical protein LJC34_00655 [Oscillospiraceae bacterium OttesenSCG-928-G22]|nr:hypothetical protein [Oscillospiraceae bacterium OttesenSCG-928-G22]
MDHMTWIAIGVLFAAALVTLALQFASARETKKELENLKARLPSESSKRREERVIKLYQNLEELMEAFESYVEETRAELERLRRETAARGASLSRARERQPETKDTSPADTDYRAQMRLPLSDMELPDEDGVVLELNRVPRTDGAAMRKIEVPLRPAEVARQDELPPEMPPAVEAIAAEEPVSTPEPVSIPEPVSAPEPAPAVAEALFPIEEPLEDFIPPAATAPAGGTVIRPFSPEDVRLPERIAEEDLQASKRFATKPQKIRFLASKGYHPDDIARELGIGKGEVTVVLRIDA